MTDQQVLQRAQAALSGVEVGDALGKLTEGYRPHEIVQTYGGPITGFASRSGPAPVGNGPTPRSSGERA